MVNSMMTLESATAFIQQGKKLQKNTHARFFWVMNPQQQPKDSNLQQPTTISQSITPVVPISHDDTFVIEPSILISSTSTTISPSPPPPSFSPAIKKKKTKRHGKKKHKQVEETAAHPVAQQTEEHNLVKPHKHHHL